MTTFKSTLSLWLLQLVFQMSYGQSKTVIIEYAGNNLKPERYQLFYFKTNQFDDDANMKTIVSDTNASNEILRWELETTIPVVLSATSHFIWDNGSIPIEPGDSVRITQTSNGLAFSGTAADKFELSYRLSQVVSPAVVKMLGRYLYIDSLGEFNTYFDISEKKLLTELALIDQYRPKVTHLATQYLRGYYLNGFRHKVATKFERAVFSRRKFNVPVAYYQPIYDSTVAKYWPSTADSSDLSSLSTRTATALKKYVTTKVNFEQLLAGTYDGDEEEMLYRQYYKEAKSRYTGLAQRKALSYLLRSLLDDELSPTAIALSEDFLALPGYQQYHDYIKNRLTIARRFEKGSMAPSFSLTTVSGKEVTTEDLRGKIVIMDFWFTGCVGCIQMTPALKKAEEAFSNNNKVIFLNVSVDKDKQQWAKSVTLGRYTTGTGLVTYTGGRGVSHPIIEDYDISSYPTVFIIDADGRFVKVNQDPRHDNGQSLVQQIKDMLPAPKWDGPYVLYKPEGIVMKSVVEQNGNLVANVVPQQSAAGPVTFTVKDGYSGKSFSVELQKELTIPPAEYVSADKILAISDIEGNLDAFTNLLKGNGVIDDQYNWIFGNGHVVLLGDFFDRGHQVTEVLWLAYSLEAKAREQGGYVHFILGNHEIMNMKGQLNYVQRKYKQNATLIQEDYTTGLYGENSELGRWLRTKNIAERIGNLLFIHGGISAPVNRLGLTLEQINDISRSQIGMGVDTTQPTAVQLLASTVNSPFWYRGYYRGAPTLAPQSQIDSTLQKFRVDKIVTGHTIIEKGESITTHFQGKVINVDTHHASGHSAALLVEGGRFFGVDVLHRKKALESVPTAKPSSGE